jgi:hypothetical protein
VASAAIRAAADYHKHESCQSWHSNMKESTIIKNINIIINQLRADKIFWHFVYGGDFIYGIYPFCYGYRHFQKQKTLVFDIVN